LSEPASNYASSTNNTLEDLTHKHKLQSVRPKGLDYCVARTHSADSRTFIVK
jgi:hypothetical protein